MFEPMPASDRPALGVRVWPVGSLLRAIADSLEARFNPVAVKGEIAGFSRATSGHCYFNLKDEQGQVRCAMFRRSASLLDFSPRDGMLVEVRGRLGVYEPRGELQLGVESLREAGQGNWFEQFARLKAKLDAEGLFDVARKRSLPLLRHWHHHLAGCRCFARCGQHAFASRTACLCGDLPGQRARCTSGG